MDFYQSMTTQGAQSPPPFISALMGQGILEASTLLRLSIFHSARGSTHFRSGPLYLSETWSTSIEETSGDSFILRKELPSGMLLVDVLLRSNIFPSSASSAEARSHPGRFIQDI
ncbi:hypothetical protein CK203_059228 [Vitis vinifera]|uniref:Uncharacterized protein n=1 Tax=Vitis vinifera TaxID=29760 RepID=A0A438GEC2_VITVI|nr:hypothetical protein CK203_059228 [Vitis vinifera]